MERFNIDLIEDMEVKTIMKSPDWYYHGFDFGNVGDILSKGILAKKYLDYPNPNFGLNGKYYISVSKDIDQFFGAFNLYKSRNPLIVLDNVRTIKCRQKELNYLLRNTMLPLRYSTTADEYQVYSKIIPEKFVGIECMVYAWCKSNNIFLLKRLREMLIVMKDMGVQLPIYDFSREKDGIVHELDKNIFLEKSKYMFNKR